MMDLPSTQNPPLTPPLKKGGELDGFRQWLKSKNYSSSTTRNYLVDVNKFLQFSHLDKLDELSNFQLENYLKTISSDPNYSRYLSSLNKFFDFALDQNLVSENPLKKILKRNDQSVCKPSLSIENLVSQYKQHLELKHKSSTTIKNYINDIQQYLNFCESQKLNDQFQISNDQKSLDVNNLKIRN